MTDQSVLPKSNKEKFTFGRTLGHHRPGRYSPSRFLRLLHNTVLQRRQVAALPRRRSRAAAAAAAAGVSISSLRRVQGQTVPRLCRSFCGLKYLKGEGEWRVERGQVTGKLKLHACVCVGVMARALL